MYEAKTKARSTDVRAYLNAIENPRRRADALRLLDIFTETSGLPAVLWGDSIVGFGQYHYKYARGHEGDAAMIGFAPRKASISLYLSAYDEERSRFLARLGKHKAAVSCIYVNKLDDIDEQVLREMIVHSLALVKKQYPNNH